MMKVIFLTGSHPRHLHIAKRLLEENLIHGLLVEQREELIPVPGDWIEQDKNNFVRHFKDREAAENRTFGSISISCFEKLPVFSVTMDQLNHQKTRDWIVTQKPDIVVSYGIHKLEKETLEVLPQYAWNIHGGLSPWFKGNTTLFWPFYFLKPNWAGMTIHELTSRLDGGDIIHHSVPQLKKGNGIHDVACNAVVQVGEDLIQILKMVKNGHVVQSSPQHSNGKLFTSLDWAPQHLRLIYNTFNNDIVDRFLDGELGCHKPELVNFFEK